MSDAKWLSEGATDEEMRLLGAEDQIREEAEELAERRAAFEIRQGDALSVLRTLPDESVNCCITSPPYYGLRDYGTAKWEGGDVECEHKPNPHAPTQKLEGGTDTVLLASNGSYRDICRKCGARRIDSQIGLERTPAEYIARLVEVFREVRRVLKSDGTLWVVIGDSYASQGGAHGGRGDNQRGVGAKKAHNLGCGDQEPRRPSDGLKPKDLIGIPWLLAFALRDDGWYLRQDCIWSKTNPMPESVRDRCTKAHEYIFILTKSARYWWDAELNRELCSGGGHGGSPGNRGAKSESLGQQKGGNLGDWDDSKGRNRRSVWTIGTQPTPEAHFATFPLELPEICLKAGCPEGGVVLDCFAGAGTTGLACLKNGRRFIGSELNPAYCEIAYNRARKYYPLLMGAA